MIIGSDLDGVIFLGPFYGLDKRIRLNFLYWFQMFRRESLFYRILDTRVNSEFVELLNRVARRGNQIIIISGRSVECARQVHNGLMNKQIPFDKLFLCPDGENHAEFKLKKIKEEGCHIYIEDRVSIVEFLEEHLNSICSIIHYKNRQSLQFVKEAINLV